MRRLVLALLVALACALPATARAQAPDFSAFSRGWYVHLGLMVIAGDGSALFDYSTIGNTASYVLTLKFSAVSDDGNTAYGTVVASDDAGLGRGGIYGWVRGADVMLSFASAHTAYLQQSGVIVFLCSSGWLTEVPQPPCGA